MEELHSNCTFCGSLQTISSDKLDVFVKHLQNAFLSRNKDCSLEEFSGKLQLCVICAQKIQLSADLKKSYDEMCNRNNRALPTKCYFCESRSYVLIDTGDNPNDFDRKMELFHNSVVVRHSYENLCACTKCLYNLHIWWETRSNLSAFLKIPDTSDEVLNNNNMDANMKVHRYSQRTPVRKLQRNGKFARASIHRSRDKFKLHLQRKLKIFKSARNIMQRGDIHTNGFDIADDDKMFKEIPYVKVLVGSQISLETLNFSSNSNDVLVISDSEDEFNFGPMRSCKYSTPLTRNGRSSTPALKKTPFKIKFSSSFSKTLQLPDKSSFICMVCEKRFSVKCEYLLHLLRHQKVESLIVKVTKYNLPKHINVHDFKQNEAKKTKRLSVPANVINRLLVKYIGENTANTFSELDESKEEIGTADTFEEPNESEKQKGAANTFDDESEKQECPSERSKEMDELRVNSPTIMHGSETVSTSSQEIFNEIDENRNISPVLGYKEKADCENNIEHQSAKSLQENIVDKSVDDIEIENSNENDENGKNSDDCVEIQDTNENNDGKKSDDCVQIEDSNKNDDNIINLDEDVESEDTNRNGDKENKNLSGKGNDAEINNDYEELSDTATDIINTLEDSGSDIANVEVIEDIQVSSDLNLQSTTEEVIAIQSDEESGDNQVVSAEMNSAGKKQCYEKQENERKKLSPLYKTREPVLTNQELLNILDSNIGIDDSESNGAEIDSLDLSYDDPKLRNTKFDCDTETPKRKRVRFANEKEIVTPDRSVILLEKVREDNCNDVG